jgi:uncharacterized membrane protein
MNMNSTKIAAAIVIAGIVIGAAVYLGLTQDRRGFMSACMQQNMSAMSSSDAEDACAIHFQGRR